MYNDVISSLFPMSEIQCQIVVPTRNQIFVSTSPEFDFKVQAGILRLKGYEVVQFQSNQMMITR